MGAIGSDCKVSFAPVFVSQEGLRVNTWEMSLGNRYEPVTSPQQFMQFELDGH